MDARPDLFSLDSNVWAAVTVSLLLSVAAVVLATLLWWRLHRSRVAAPRFANDDPPLDQAGKPLHENEKNNRAADDALITWSPETLRQLLAAELPDAQVIVVSNREPYIHNLVDDKVKLLVPASGLVSALEPVTRTCSGTWIAYGGGSADRLTVDDHDRIQVPPDKPSYVLRRVWLSEEELQGYYYGFANDGLWPLCHIAFTRPIFRASDFEMYEAVNQKFADVVAEEAKNERPIVLVQDYHFALLPRMIRQRLPDAIIITFWHIPWPNSEVFGICPWRERILDGLLGSSIVGFHIQFHCNNFTESVDRFLESRIEREEPSISYRGATTLVHPYPISIEWPPAGFQNQPEAAECRRGIFERFDLPADARLCVGVERLDYTKGILDRFMALDEFFQKNPDWIGRVVFLQIAAPSRGTLAAYQQLHRQCLDYVDEFNRRYGNGRYKPIILLDEYHNQEDICRVYRAADICVVSSLHDGMNLVAKEFVATRDDEQGVLILSTFAGASRELLDALIVNPYDPNAVSDALLRGLCMPPDEQRERMRRMREVVRNNNVYRWAGSMLLDAARLRKRNEAYEAAETGPRSEIDSNVVPLVDKKKDATG